MNSSKIFLYEQAKTTDKNIDDNIDDPFINDNEAIDLAKSSEFLKDNSSSSSSIKIARDSFISASFDNKPQDLDSISPDPKESEMESIDIDQSEEIRKLTQVFILLFARFIAF